MSAQASGKAKALRHYVAMAREAREDSVCGLILVQHALRLLEWRLGPYKWPQRHVRAFYDCE